MSSELEATSFIKSEGFYLEEFKAVLNLLMYCYSEILTNELPNSYKKGFQLENHLRNVLVKKYLRIYKEKYGISYLGFEIESGEINLGYVTVGFIDIKVINAGLIDSLKCNEDIYYGIECKMLNENSEKINKYIEEGIFRFVSGKYSSKMPLAGMVGFIDKHNPNVIVKKINTKLKEDKTIVTAQYLKKLNLHDDFEYSYLSKHERINNNDIIDIYHLMFDYGSLILNDKTE